MKPDINPMRSAFGPLFAAALITISGPTSASPITLSCQFLDSNDPNHWFAEADQFIYDLEGQSAELRVARTMGTGTPVNWIFVTRRTALDDDRFTVKETAQGIIGAGIYGSAPHSFDLYDSGLLVWSFLWFSAQPTWLNWHCER